MPTTVNQQALAPVGMSDKIKDEIILAMAHELKDLRDQLANRTSVSSGSQPMDVALQGGQSSDGTAGESLRRQLEDVLRARENERSVYTETLNSVVSELTQWRQRYEETKRALQRQKNAQDRPSDSSTESPMDTDTETVAEEDAKLTGFLDAQGDQAGGHLPAVDFYESPVGVNLWAALRKDLPDPSILDKVLHPDIVMWRSDHLGAKRCLLFYASQRFTLSDKSTKAEGCSQSLNQGDTREIICKIDKTWAYCGTYKCTNIWSASEEELNTLKPPHTLMNGIMQRTVTFAAKGGIPAHVGKLVREMYRCGTLSVRCYAMELVDRVEALDDAFERCAVRRADSKRPSDDEEEGSRKKQKSS